MGWRVTPLDEYNINHVLPDDEIDSHSLEYIIEPVGHSPHSVCPCKPYLTGNSNMTATWVHSSFDGREYVERAQEIINSGN